MGVPQLGDIGFVSISGGAGFFIRIAQFLNGNGFHNYQHAFVVVDQPSAEEPNSGYLVEAEPGGARRVPLDEYAGTNVVYFSDPELTEGQRIDIAGIAQHMVGTPYSFLDYLAIALLRFHFPSLLLRRYIASRKHLMCSQLVDWVYNAAGVKLFTDGRLPGDVDPLELMAQCIRLGWTEH